MESAAPAHWTTDVGTKLPPLTVRVVSPAPWVTLVGLIDESDGVGLLTVNVWALEAPPPGAGLVTVTLKAPAVAMSDALMAAVTLVADT